MKYIALGILSLVFALNVSAQKIVGSAILPAHIYNTDKATPDTIFHDFFNLSPVIYTAPVGGYMSGTNGYMETEKGQETKVSQTYRQTGVIYWFALKEKNTGLDTSAIIFKQYKKDGLQLIEGVSTLVPGTLQASDTVALSVINADTVFANGLNVFLFPQPIVNIQAYVSTFSMELMNPRDTIALYNTTDSLVDVTSLSWEKWTGKWNTILNAWELDVDFAIFPIRDLDGASITEQKTEAVVLSPNPADDFIRVNLNNTQRDSYVLMNSSGQVIKNGNITSNLFDIDLQGLASGYYIVGVYSGNGMDASFYRFIKK